MLSFLMVFATSLPVVLLLLDSFSAAHRRVETYPVSKYPAHINIPGQSCTISSMSQVASCLGFKNIVIKDLVVPAGTTLAFENLLSGTTITFLGVVTFGYTPWEGPLVSMSGTGVTVQGHGILDGQGAHYWDGKGDAGTNKPKFFFAHGLHNSLIKDIVLRNTPIQAFSVVSNNLMIESVTVDNRDGEDRGAANTDAFDISNSNRVALKNCTVYNQDDCVAINSGENISVLGLFCHGGHGISIGSVGGRSNNVVNKVVVSDSIITNSLNGLRIKTLAGAVGSVSNVYWRNIRLTQIIEHAIIIEQDYKDSGPTGIPSRGVPITGVTARAITGTTQGKQIYILCAACYAFDFDRIQLSGGQRGGVTGVTL